MPDAAYFRAWRAAHPEYRERQNRLRNERRAAQGRGDRAREYAKRPIRAVEPLPELYPNLRHGRVLSFREDELKMDIEQERALAVIEGRDPDDAATTYRRIEQAWWAFTAPLREAS